MADCVYDGVYSLLDKVLKSYESYFDITRDFRFLQWQIPAFARFYSKSERYVLSKRAKLWGAEAYEYLFFFCEDTLTLPRWEEIREILIQGEKELVKPHGEHMYSFVSAVILCGRISDEAKAALSRFRFHKNYRFSWHGWMSARVAAVSVSDGMLVCNRAGKDIKAHLRRIIERDSSR